MSAARIVPTSLLMLGLASACGGIDIEAARVFCLERDTDNVEVYAGALILDDVADRADVKITTSSATLDRPLDRAEGFDFAVPRFDAMNMVIGSDTLRSYTVAVPASEIGVPCAQATTTSWVFTAQKGEDTATSDPITPEPGS